MNLNLDDLKPEPNGPTMADLERARQIMEHHDVVWALNVLAAAARVDLRTPSDDTAEGLAREAVSVLSEGESWQAAKAVDLEERLDALTGGGS